jgi:hypothetical protein
MGFDGFLGQHRFLLGILVRRFDSGESAQDAGSSSMTSTNSLRFALISVALTPVFSGFAQALQPIWPEWIVAPIAGRPTRALSLICARKGAAS